MNGKLKNSVNVLLFLSPWLIGASVFLIYPVFASIYFSFCAYSGLQQPIWIGLENYKELMTDKIFWISLGNTLYYAAISIPLNTLASLFLAFMLNVDIKGRSIFRVIFYLPCLMPAVASAVLWMWIFNGEYGILNSILSVFGVHNPPNWLGDRDWVKPSLIFMGLWGIGQQVIIYLAALGDVPKSLLEAAEIDGANPLQKTMNVSIPILSPSIYFNVIMGIIGSLQIFIQPYMMTGGGPDNASNMYTLYLYRSAFEDLRFGFASAMAWILFLIILALTLLANAVSKKFVHYMGE